MRNNVHIVSIYGSTFVNDPPRLFIGSFYDFVLECVNIAKLHYFYGGLHQRWCNWPLEYEAGTNLRRYDFHRAYNLAVQLADKHGDTNIKQVAKIIFKSEAYQRPVRA